MVFLGCFRVYDLPVRSFLGQLIGGQEGLEEFDAFFYRVLFEKEDWREEFDAFPNLIVVGKEDGLRGGNEE